MNEIISMLNTFNGRQTEDKIIDYLNVLLVGIAGSGKTLLGEVLSGARSTEPPKPTMATSIDQIKLMKMMHSHQRLQLIDTPGFDPYNYVGVLNMIRNYITDCNSSHDYRQHIHIALLCVPESRRRFEDGELNVLRMLINCGVSSIIVITQSIDQQSSVFINELRRIVSAVGSIPIVSILAADYKLMNNYIVEAHGVDLMLTTIADKTIDILNNSVARANKPNNSFDLRTIIVNIYRLCTKKKTKVIVVASAFSIVFLFVYYLTRNQASVLNNNKLN